MTEKIKSDSRISEKSRQDILESIYDKSDENSPLSKAYYDNIVTGLEEKKRRNIEHLKKFSEICYYSAGAYTNNAIISSNTYLDSNSLSIINSRTKNSHLSSEFYNATSFINILKALGIIEDENEICQLTFSEISYLKEQSVFKKFLDVYYELSNSMDQLDEYLKQKRQRYDRLELIKSLVFNFGLTMSELVLTNYYFEINMDPISYGFILWLLQTYIENTKFKPVRSLKCYTVDCIIDKIGFGNDFFLEFCHKIKKTIEKCNGDM